MGKAQTLATLTKRERRQVNVTLSPRLFKWLSAQAESAGVSTSELVRWKLIAEFEGERKAAKAGA